MIDQNTDDEFEHEIDIDTDMEMHSNLIESKIETHFNNTVNLNVHKQQKSNENENKNNNDNENDNEIDKIQNSHTDLTWQNSNRNIEVFEKDDDKIDWNKNKGILKKQQESLVVDNMFERDTLIGQNDNYNVNYQNAKNAKNKD